MPDFRNESTINKIFNKSSVLSIGCELLKFKLEDRKKENQPPVIVWNHRWEYDKNPELFFKTLYKIKHKNIDFKLVVLGESFNEYPNIFNEAKVELKNNLLHFGFCQSFKEYKNWLSKSDILPVTSIQDFFGVSIVEGIYAKTLPVLPNRLSYPELINIDNNKRIFYNTEKEFMELLIYNIIHYKDLRKYTNKYKDLISRFDWSSMKNVYDDKFEKIFTS
jgi:glycosyltransferase involved in cell wall biosynthesis